MEMTDDDGVRVETSIIRWYIIGRESLLGVTPRKDSNNAG